MKKINDTELMNDFNEKYSKMNHGEFLDKIMENHNDCKYTRLYKEILNSENFRNFENSWDALISMKSAINRFNPTEADLKHELSERLTLLQDLIDKHPGYGL